MASTKIQIVNQAFEDIRISGLTVTQGPAGNVLGLRRLEDMMQECFLGQNLDVGYNFEETPDPNTPTGVSDAFRHFMSTNTAMRIVAAYGKDAPATLASQARGSTNTALAIVARQQTRQVQPSRRMPRGSGNEIRSPNWLRFEQPVQEPPTIPDRKTIYDGETQDYTEDFTAWLGDNSVASFTIAADPRLTIDSSSEADGVITYTVTASNDPAEGVWQYVEITVTDSAGRVNIRYINFRVFTPPEVT